MAKANINNKNAEAGKNIEHLIKNSIVDYPSVIKKLKNHFKIQGKLDNTASSGIYGDKADIRINFSCGHYIDVNIKGFKTKTGFNQLTRASVSKFCEIFKLDNNKKRKLENIVVAKSKNTKNPLFTETQQKEWGKFFEDNAKKMLKWGFSKNASREILLLFNRDSSVAKIYPMKEVLNCLPTDITFSKGGFNIGSCVSFQRKGGNGSLSKTIPKTAIKHPGNNIQLKIKSNKLIKILEPIKLTEYTI